MDGEYGELYNKIRSLIEHKEYIEITSNEYERIKDIIDILVKKHIIGEDQIKKV